MNKLWLILGLVLLLVLGFHDYSQTRRLQYAYEHPATVEKIVYKDRIKTNIVTVEKIVKAKDGSETIVRTITDKSVEDKSGLSDKQSKPILPSAQGTYLVGAGITLTQTIYADLGTHVLFFDCIVSLPVSPLAFSPRLDLLISF